MNKYDGEAEEIHLDLAMKGMSVNQHDLSMSTAAEGDLKNTTKRVSMPYESSHNQAETTADSR